MKVVAELGQDSVSVSVTSTVNGEDVTQDMQFPFENIGDGMKIFRITDEAIQDLVAFINNAEDN